jgi:hypothetical protein
MSHDWHDVTFAKQQQQRLSHNQPLEKRHVQRPMTRLEWLVCAAVIFGGVWLVFWWGAL